MKKFDNKEVPLLTGIMTASVITMRVLKPRISAQLSICRGDLRYFYN